MATNAELIRVENVFKLYNNGDNDYAVSAGDKISQLVILPILRPHTLIVDDLIDTERGNGGFGSTGYK